MTPHLDERMADVQACDLESEPCDLDGQVPRAGRHLEHLRARREGLCQLSGLLPVFL